jgi:hypothetical protein
MFEIKGRLGIERVAYLVRDYHLGKVMVHGGSHQETELVHGESQRGKELVHGDSQHREMESESVNSYDQTVAEMRKWLNTVKDQVQINFIILDEKWLLPRLSDD